MPSRPLTDSEVNLVLSTTDNLMHRTLFILGIRTGFRISELLSLTTKDIDENSITVRRCNMKGKHSSRSVVLHDQAKAVLKEYMAMHKLWRLFPISRFQAHRLFKKMCHAARLTGRISTHSMRKSFGMKVYDRTGKDIIAVQKALGHKSLASTTHYLSIGQDIVDAAILSE